MNKQDLFLSRSSELLPCFRARDSSCEKRRMEGPSLVSTPCYLEPLTVENLLRMRSKLESEGQMTRERKARFNGVLRMVKESELVQSNARTVIECDRGDLEYLCSDGGETVFVLCQGGEPLYIGKKRDNDSYPSPPLPEAERLSIRHLLGAMSRLETQHRMTEQLRTCFECALENFRKEPNFVQENARLVISCEGKERHFASGNGENEFVVYLQNGKPRYESHVLGWGAYLFKMLARLF